MKKNFVKPIPTKYNGVQFRSRLEARWALVFDRSDLDWHYEPEGYQLPSGWYVPDFFVSSTDPGFEYSCYCEIKPCFPSEEEIRKAAELAWHLETAVYIYYGPFGAMPKGDEAWGENDPLLVYPDAGTYHLYYEEEREHPGEKSWVPVEKGWGVFGFDDDLIANPLSQERQLLEPIKFAQNFRFW